MQKQFARGLQLSSHKRQCFTVANKVAKTPKKISIQITSLKRLIAPKFERKTHGKTSMVDASYATRKRH